MWTKQKAFYEGVFTRFFWDMEKYETRKDQNKEDQEIQELKNLMIYRSGNILALNTRARKIFARIGIPWNLQSIINTSKTQLLCQSNCGHKTIKHINDQLAKVGLGPLPE